MVSSATAYSIYMKVQDLHASKSEECEKEGTDFSFPVNFSQKRLDIFHMFLISLCASLRSANDHLVRLWLRCDFSTLCNVNILFHTRAYKFCVWNSQVVSNMETKFHLHTTCGRCEMKPNSYTIQIFRTKIYIPNLSQITEGVLKVSWFHISSRLKKECKQVLVKKFSE